jgi:hypothetical protein
VNAALRERINQERPAKFMNRTATPFDPPEFTQPARDDYHLLQGITDRATTRDRRSPVSGEDE